MASALAAFISNELARRNMTQIELEQLSGIPDSTLSRIITGKLKEPKPSQIARIAKAFKMDFWDVMLHVGFPAWTGQAGAAEQRIAAILAADSDLTETFDRFLDLPAADRRSVRDLIDLLHRRLP